MNLTIPDLAYIGSLPPEVLADAENWRDALLDTLNASRGTLTTTLQQIARRMGVSYQTARRKYDSWRHAHHSIRALVNNAKIPQGNSAVTAEFLEWFKGIVEDNQRKTKPAWRTFCRMWKRGETIPGMDNTLPRHCLPPGFGYDNLAGKIRDVFATTAMRQGLGAAIAKCGPQIFSNRADLWLMSHMMIDDLWHDNFVVFQRQIVRVLELDALDAFSGNLITFGCKPRTQRPDGTFENLKERYARLLVAGVFVNTGYSPRGTWMMAELGTAAISEHVARVLYDRTGGLIRLRENGITGNEQAIIGWRGQGKGNPRFKAALESIRNLKHNELADARTVPGQTGKDVEHRPEYLHGQLKDCEETLKAMAVLAMKNPARARQLKLNLLDYHADFLPLLMDVYREINQRTWHDLQGWHEIPGNCVIEYRTTPTSDRWLTDAEFSSLPEISKQLLLTAAAEDKRYLNTRKLSPAEVFDRHSQELIKLPPFVVGELLGDDYARELEVVGAYFREFQDAELCPEPLRYESVIVTPDGQRQQLSDGKYLVFANPFDLSHIFVHNARGVCLGVAPRVQRINPANLHQLHSAYAYRAKRLTELQAPILKRHAGMVRDETDRLAHNARVLDTSKPFTQEERDQAALVATEGPAAANDILASAIADPAIGNSEAADDLLSAIAGQPPAAEQ
ncbi:MAG: hypothetical protein ABFD89_05285 [Bryobacteraceae bacterium]